MASWCDVRVWAAALSTTALVVVAAGSAGCQRSSEARFAGNTAGVGAAGVDPNGSGAGLMAGPNVIGINCDTGECQASCMAGSTILLAYGFHGREYDSGGPVSQKCGEGVEWLGGCIGQASCSVATTCTSSAMYLICR